VPYALSNETNANNITNNVSFSENSSEILIINDSEINMTESVLLNETEIIINATQFNESVLFNETLELNQSNETIPIINETDSLPAEPQINETIPQVNETEPAINDTQIIIESEDFLKSETSILSDNKYFTKAGNNRSLIISTDEEELFVINSTSKLHYVGDVIQTKEWAYKNAGVETLRSDEELIILNDHVCKKNNYVLQDAGTLFEQKTYTSCVYYPQQIKEVEASSYVDDTGEVIQLPKGSTLPMNVRTIEQISSTKVEITFEDDYDPTVAELTTGLVSYWVNDDLFDSHGSNNIQTNIASNATGKLDNAYDYDGSNDFTNISHHSSIDLSDAVSISVWLNSDNQKHGYVVAKYGAYMIQMSNTGGNLQGGFWISSSWNPWVETGNTSASTWHHVVFTYDKDTIGPDDVKMYLNGAKVDTNNQTLSFDTNTNPLYFGNRHTDLARDFDGIIDEVGIWNIALNDSQVSELYNSNNGLAYPFEEATTGDINFTYPTPSNAETVVSATINASSNYGSNHSIHLDWDNLLLLWWNFDNISGTTIYDHSIHNRDGTIINGATIENATRGNGMSVNGINQYARIDHDEVFDELPLTLETWIRFDSMPSSRSEAAYFLQKKHSADPWRSWALSVGTDDKIRLLIKNTSEDSTTIYSDNALSVNNWYHVVATLDSDTNMSLYVNGVAQAQSYTFGDLYDSDGQVRVGADWSGGGRMNGTLDEVKIHNRLLSLNEIQASYNALNNPYLTSFAEEGSHNYTAYLITDEGTLNSTELRTVEIGEEGETLYLNYSKYIAACWPLRNGTLCLNSAGFYTP